MSAVLASLDPSVVVASSAVLAAGGAVLLAAAVTGVVPRPGPRAARPEPSAQSPGGVWWRLLAGLAVAAAVEAATGWPSAAFWIGVLVAWIPSLAVKGRQRRQEMEVAAGVARVAAMLRDQVLIGADVAESFQGCVAKAPTVIAPAVASAAEGLKGGEPAEVLARFALSVGDPMGDMLAVSLGFAMTQRTAKLADLLDEVAEGAEDQVKARRSIEKDRRRVRTVVWGVMAAVVGWLVVIYAISGAYLSPYNGLRGQFVLFLVGAVFAAGLGGLAKMDSIGSAKRLLLAAGPQSSAMTVGAGAR